MNADRFDVDHLLFAAAANPFATRYTRPGAIPPLDDSGNVLDPERWLDALDRMGGCGAFVGPHGSGKTTRLEACAAAAAAQGRTVDRFCLRGRGDAARAVWRLLTVKPGSLACIDGLERAGPILLRLIRQLARWRRVRLLATLHDAGSLPVIARCATSPRLLAALVEWLPDHRGRVSEADLADAYAFTDGNLREAFFRLYDQCEALRSLPGCPVESEGNGRMDRAD